MNTGCEKTPQVSQTNSSRHHVISFLRQKKDEHTKENVCHLSLFISTRTAKNFEGNHSQLSCLLPGRTTFLFKSQQVKA